MSSDILLGRAASVVVLLLSLSVHEFSHAWSASRLGDDTAARMGRLTLNPLAHADLLGTIILPLLGIPFGWAKPVPVNPARFRRDVSMRAGMMITAAAGPISNLVLAVVCSVLFGVAARIAPALIAFETPSRALLVSMISLNVVLALFNLIPVPPLDGSRIVDGLLPLRLRPAWESFSRIGPFLLLAVFWFGGRIIAGPTNAVMDLLQGLINSIV